MALKCRAEPGTDRSQDGKEASGVCSTGSFEASLALRQLCLPKCKLKIGALSRSPFQLQVARS
jgi:hypothetical protein